MSDEQLVKFEKLKLQRKNAMQKYRCSDKGKCSQKKAQKKYRAIKKYQRMHESTYEEAKVEINHQVANGELVF
tara:strand:+ start:2654 stop:2872 length:219 start_codon:yes stop_codon:yes gene_type:complete